MSIDLDLSAAPLSSCPCSVRPFGDLTLRASPAAGVDWEIPMSDWRAAASSWAPVDCVGVAGEAMYPITKSCNHKKIPEVGEASRE